MSSNYIRRAALAVAAVATAGTLGSAAAITPASAETAAAPTTANLVQWSDLTHAGFPTKGRTTDTGTGHEDQRAPMTVCADQFLSQVSPSRHGAVTWVDRRGPGFWQATEELTQAKTATDAHEIAMIAYYEDMACGSSGRHAIAIDGGSITWFEVKMNGNAYHAVTSVIRVGNRVALVSFSRVTSHARVEALLRSAANRLH